MRHFILPSRFSKKEQPLVRGPFLWKGDAVENSINRVPESSGTAVLVGK